MLMAQAAIAQSVAIAAMPTFSAQFALGKLDEMRTSLASSIRGRDPMVDGFGLIALASLTPMMFVMGYGMLVT